VFKVRGNVDYHNSKQNCSASIRQTLVLRRASISTQS